MSDSLKKIFYFEKNEISKTILKKICVVICGNIFLFQQKNYFAFHIIFTLIQEEVLCFHLFINLYFYINFDYKRGIEKDQLSRNDIRILHTFSINLKSELFFINETKNNIILLPCINKHNFFFSIKNILIFSNRGFVINLMSNFNKSLFFCFSQKNYKFFRSKR